MADEQSQPASAPGPSQEDTQQVEVQTSPAADSGNEGQGNQVSTQTSSDEDTESIRSRLEGKLRQEQDNLKDLDSRYRNVVSAVADDPDILKRVYIKANGLSEEEAIERVRQVYPDYGSNAGYQNQSNQSSTQNVPTAPQAPELDPYERAAIARIAGEEREKSKKTLDALTSFDKQYEGQYDWPTKKVIAAEAQRLFMQGKDVTEALEEARLKIAHPEEYTERGVTEGMARAYSSMGQQSAGAGGGARAKGEPVLTREAEEVMEKLGLRTKEEKETYMKYAAE